jgi:hypothetical protein
MVARDSSAVGGGVEVPETSSRPAEEVPVKSADQPKKYIFSSKIGTAFKFFPADNSKEIFLFSPMAFSLEEQKLIEKDGCYQFYVPKGEIFQDNLGIMGVKNSNGELFKIQLTKISSEPIDKTVSEVPLPISRTPSPELTPPAPSTSQTAPKEKFSVAHPTF